MSYKVSRREFAKGVAEVAALLYAGGPALAFAQTQPSISQQFVQALDRNKELFKSRRIAGKALWIYTIKVYEGIDPNYSVSYSNRGGLSYPDLNTRPLVLKVSSGKTKKKGVFGAEYDTYSQIEELEDTARRGEPAHYRKNESVKLKVSDLPVQEQLRVKTMFRHGLEILIKAIEDKATSETQKAPKN